MAANKRVFVFLHGLTVLREVVTGLQVVLPRVPGHVFKAGSWLTETPIDRNAALQLRGVIAGNASLSSTKAIVGLPGCSLTNKGWAASLDLPLPKTIFELLLAAAVGFVRSPNPITSASTGGVTPAQIPAKLAMTLVLAYEYVNENDVFLDNHYWEPAATDGAISLHVISTSDGPEGLDHEVRTERALGKLIQGYPGLNFAKPAPVPPAWDDNVGPDHYGDLTIGDLGFQLVQGIPGDYLVTSSPIPNPAVPNGLFAFARAELEPYTTREVRLRRLGRLKQQGRPIENLWQEPDPLGAAPCDCGHLKV